MNLERRSRIDRLIGLLESAREEAGRLADEAEAERSVVWDNKKEYAAATRTYFNLDLAKIRVRQAIVFLREAKEREA